MSEQEFNIVFSKRLRYYLNKFNMTQTELAKKLGVGTTSVYNWCNGIKAPRMDKIDAMCDLFGCNRSDLIEERASKDALPYYLNEDAKEMAEFMFKNPEYKVLFDASRKVKKEDIAFVKKMIDRVRGDSDDAGC